jgi:EAL domain-containing protein (putative c-di-GMP-specific phosphodiesterase class I)
VIVDSLLTIAQKLGIGVIAEGIEDPSQLAQLQTYGGTLGQGYLFSQGVASHEMTDLLLQRVPYGWEQARPVATKKRLRSAR